MYAPKTKPYAHQEAAWRASWDKKYWALFFEMGLGKTKISIDTIGALYEAGRIDAALILAPKGVFDNWVVAEIPVHLPDRIPHQVMRWQPNITKRYREELRAFALPHAKREPKLRIFGMNIEALSTQKGADTALAFVKLV